MPSVKRSRAIIPVEIKGIRSLVQALLVLANLVESVRERIVEVKRQADARLLVQAEESRVVVRTAVAADDVRVQNLGEIRSPVVQKPFPEVRIIERREATEVINEELGALARGTEAVGNAQRLEKRLIGDFGCIDVRILNHRLGNIAPCLGKSLSGKRIHVRYLLESVTLIEPLGVIPDVADLQQHVAAEFALVGQIKSIGVADLAVRINPEVQRFKRAIRSRKKARNQRLAGWNGCQGRHRACGSVRPNAEGVAGVRVSASDACSGFVRTRAADVITETDSQRRDHHDADAVDAVKHSRITTAQDGFPVSKQAAK